jgi:hypothetical protein
MNRLKNSMEVSGEHSEVSGVDPEVSEFCYTPEISFFYPKYRVKNALKWLSARSFGRNFRNFGSTIRVIWLPKLWVHQKFTKYLPKLRKSGNRRILRSFGRKNFTVCGACTPGSKSTPETNESSGQLIWQKKISNLDDVRWHLLKKTWKIPLKKRRFE